MNLDSFHMVDSVGNWLFQCRSEEELQELQGLLILQFSGTVQFFYRFR